MNEITQSILRRLRYEAETAAIVHRPASPVAVKPDEFQGLMMDCDRWGKSYAVAIDGVPLKVLWPTT